VIYHYYHIYADGLWRVPLAEQVSAIQGIDEMVTTRVGIVGSPQNRADVIEQLPGSWIIGDVADEGWEQVTLEIIRWDLPQIDGPVLYAHTKGAANASATNHAWRGCMIRNTVGRWREAVRDLEHADLVGVHWFTPEEHPDKVTTPFFGGNFWWARPDYLAKLPAPTYETRYHAEAWVGQNQPVIVDRQPGWPGLVCKEH
jgi:hypothetical protein